MNYKTTKSIHYLTCLLGISQLYAWATNYYLPASLIARVSNEIGASTVVLMGGFSWALLISGLVAPLIGRWIEQEGGRRPLACGSLCNGLGLLILSQAQELLVWYLAWTFLGLGMGLGLFNAAFAALGRFLGQNAKKIIVRVTLISGFATLIWPLTTYLFDNYGWRQTLVWYAIPHLIVFFPVFFLLFLAICFYWRLQRL